MKFDQHARRMDQRYLTWLGGLCAVGLVCGCSASAPEDFGQTEQELRREAPQQRRMRRHPRRPRPPAPPPCSVFTDPDTLFQLINADLARIDAEDTVFTRYLSLADRANESGCGAELNADRAALNKLLNSLSISATSSQAIAVDADETLYRIDLRDFDWDRSVRVAGTSFPDVWEALTASSPYAVPFVGDDADDAVADTRTKIPVLFGSAFVAAATRAALYYGVLQIPRNVGSFVLDELGIDAASARAEGNVVRAGIRQGGTALLAERFDLEVRSGSLWQFVEPGNTPHLFQQPLGTPPGARELVFTLPNGLLGHVLASATGRRDDAADIVEVLRRRGAGVELPQRLRGTFPSRAAVEQLESQDRAALATALTRVGIDIDAEPEPISNVFDRFDADVDLGTAAAELMVMPPDLADNLNLLDPVLGALAGGTVTRSEFDAVYAQSLCILGVVLENQVDPEACL